MDKEVTAGKTEGNPNAEESEVLDPENPTVVVEAEEGGEEEGVRAEAVPPEVEKEAREAGWVPKEDWVHTHGNEKGWKSATDFVDFRRNFLPLAQRENRELRAQLAKIQQEREQEKKERAEAEANYQRQSLKLELKQARDDGDREREDAILDKLFDLKVADRAKPAPAAAAPSPEVQRDILDFAGRNPWLKANPRLAAVFAVQLKAVNDTGAAPSLPERLEMAKDFTRRMYPEEFPGNRRTSMAESGGEHGHVNGSNKRSWSDLKPDIKAEYEDFVAKTKGVTKEALLREFPSEYFRSR
jgi:hypothetical protein